MKIQYADQWFASVCMLHKSQCKYSIYMLCNISVHINHKYCMNSDMFNIYDVYTVYMLHVA